MNSSNGTPIGERIKTLRRALNMTQATLGDRLGGISQGHVAKMENGTRPVPIEVAFRLAQVFGRDWTFFVDGPVPVSPGRVDGSPLPVISALSVNPEQPPHLWRYGGEETAQRPGVLAEGPKAYGYRVRRMSMWPRYRPGQLLYVDPDRVPKTDDGVVVVLNDGAVEVAEFVRWLGDGIVDGPTPLRIRRLHPEVQEEDVDALSIDSITGLSE
jgi:transcriptional regulator with XRE-family HTH domain